MGVPVLLREGKLITNFLITHRSPLNDVMAGCDVFGDKKDNCLKGSSVPSSTEQYIPSLGLDGQLVR
jgi:hypothetical protein